jgi:2,3-bisphosphoglycerate-dependent phosphoglycerate mutase
MKTMIRPAKLVIIRHAESARNKFKDGGTFFPSNISLEGIAGIPDHLTPLSEWGMDQAKQSSAALRERHGVPDCICSSGYLRVTQTVNGLLDAYTSKERSLINMSDNLFIRERDPGYAYDMTKPEAEHHFPWLMEHWATFGGFFARPPGGESLADVCARVQMFLDMLSRDHSGKTIFVVTHEGTIRCFRYLLEQWTYEQALKWPTGCSPKNCGVTVYEHSAVEQKLILKKYNDVFWK